MGLDGLDESVHQFGNPRDIGNSAPLTPPAKALSTQDRIKTERIIRYLKEGESTIPLISADNGLIVTIGRGSSQISGTVGEIRSDLFKIYDLRDPDQFKAEGDGSSETVTITPRTGRLDVRATVLALGERRRINRDSSLKLESQDIRIRDLAISGDQSKDTILVPIIRCPGNNYHEDRVYSHIASAWIIECLKRRFNVEVVFIECATNSPRPTEVELFHTRYTDPFDSQLFVGLAEGSHHIRDQPEGRYKGFYPIIINHQHYHDFMCSALESEFAAFSRLCSAVTVLDVFDYLGSGAKFLDQILTDKSAKGHLPNYRYIRSRRSMQDINDLFASGVYFPL